MAWPVDLDSVAFLFLGRNGNGVPDDGGELFGNATRLHVGATASNGFVALASSHSLSWIPTATPRSLPLTAIGESFAFGFDRDRNGKADASENRYGNTLRWKAMFTTSDGERPYSDVYLTTR